MCGPRVRRAVASGVTAAIASEHEERTPLPSLDRPSGATGGEGGVHRVCAAVGRLRLRQCVCGRVRESMCAPVCVCVFGVAVTSTQELHTLTQTYTHKNLLAHMQSYVRTHTVTYLHGLCASRAARITRIVMVLVHVQPNSRAVVCASSSPSPPPPPRSSKSNRKSTSAPDHDHDRINYCVRPKFQTVYYSTGYQHLYIITNNLAAVS